MQKIYSQPRTNGKTSRARAAVRVLRKQGYTWDGHQWNKPWAPEIITLQVRDCDSAKFKDKWLQAMAKDPCSGVWLHQIAEPGQSGGGCKP